jgi:hypothetical protein
VINKTALYRKSAKGTEAIGHRQHGLGPKLRSMLIVIDGKRNFDELGRLSGALGDTQQLVEQLLAEGFIEQAGVEAPPVKAPPVKAPPVKAAPPADAKALPQAQRFAVHRLTDVLGPMSEQLCMRIESTRNWEEFDAAIIHAADIVRGIKGPQLAATISAEIQAHRPA